jgi:MFS family permease
MGFYMATVTFAIAIGPLIGGWAAAEMGWRAPFFLGAAFGVISLLPLGAVRETENVPVAFEIPLRTRLVELLRRPPVLWATSLSAVTAFTQFATTITFVPIRAVELGADQVQLGLLLFVTMGTFSVASLVSGNILPVRLPDQRTLVLGLLMLTVTVLALPLIHNLLLLAVVQCVGAIGRGMYIPLIMARPLATSSSSEHAAASGVVMTGMSFGVFVGPIITGLLADNFGLDWAFVCVGLICAIATTVAIRQGRPSPVVAM